MNVSGCHVRVFLALTVSLLTVVGVRAQEAEPTPVQKLITALASDSYAEQEQAYSQLRAMGASAVPALQAALDTAPAEARQNLKRLLNELGAAVPEGGGATPATPGSGEAKPIEAALQARFAEDWDAFRLQFMNRALCLDTGELATLSDEQAARLVEAAKSIPLGVGGTQEFFMDMKSIRVLDEYGLRDGIADKSLRSATAQALKRWGLGRTTRLVIVPLKRDNVGSKTVSEAMGAGPHNIGEAKMGFLVQRDGSDWKILWILAEVPK